MSSLHSLFFPIQRFSRLWLPLTPTLYICVTPTDLNATPATKPIALPNTGSSVSKMKSLIFLWQPTVNHFLSSSFKSFSTLAIGLDQCWMMVVLLKLSLVRALLNAHQPFRFTIPSPQSLRSLFAVIIHLTQVRNTTSRFSSKHSNVTRSEARTFASPLWYFSVKSLWLIMALRKMIPFILDLRPLIVTMGNGKGTSARFKQSQLINRIAKPECRRRTNRGLSFCVVFGCPVFGLLRDFT